MQSISKGVLFELRRLVPFHPNAADESRPKNVDTIAIKLRHVFHGERHLNPSWREMDDIEREPWRRLARYFLKR